jgi:hypothetical protein
MAVARSRLWTSVGQPPTHRPPVTTSRRHRAPWPAPWWGVDHQGEAGATPGATVAPGPRWRHHRSTTDRPRLAPLPWPPMVTGPGLGSGSAPSRPAPFTCPPLPAPGGESGDGTPVSPRSRCPGRKFFQKIGPDKRPPGVGTHGGKFQRTKSDLGLPSLRQSKQFPRPPATFPPWAPPLRAVAGL